MLYIAHKNEIDNSVQTVREHCQAVAELASEYAVPPLKDIVYTMGLLHDVGKYQKSFQRKINGANIRVEHSTCGAIAAKGKYQNTILALLQYCIAGHHSGIPDGGNLNDTEDMPTLQGRLKRSFEDYSVYKDELTLPEIDDGGFNQLLINGSKSNNEALEKFAFLTRYCFSCLTDADSIDTAGFCGGTVYGEMVSDFKKCLERLNRRLSSFECTTELQKARSQIQQQVYEKSNIDSEIYLMNMPTGSGKTLCSMKFALERAIASKKKRIIYVIPYNSIIDQAAAEFEELFGEDAQILRHQSSFSYEVKNKDNKENKKFTREIDEDYKELIHAATENWNAQIIITTAVQFFESVYANKRGKLRKMHNMADSIIVFDEAHLMPIDYLQPCLRAISYTTGFLNSEAIFLTATMPNFHSLMEQYALSDSKITDLVDDTSLFGKFRKCTYVNIGEVSGESLIEKTQENPSTLIVVNTRRTAKELYNLYELCPGKKFHLSTYMTSFDRKRIIEQIKNELVLLEKDYPDMQNVPDDRRITVVSTSLIEAGVDLDFFCVYRELAGLDNILQAGGRCNREGKRTDSKVFIFSLDEGKVNMERNIRPEITRGLLSDYDDISCAECIQRYYDNLFFLNADNIKKNSITEKYRINNIGSISFSGYAAAFKIIDDSAISVAVIRDDISKELIENLKITGFTNHRALQLYTFSVKRFELEQLLEQHAVKNYGGIWILVSDSYYDSNIGVKFEASDIFS